ncbi:hypothetical protein DSO57_1031924 [Entomophthora muscae]|uniref:Uncharacterized protein n=1 Tax=Entomophthora muscae TaxID=34485 RepID=A0ACC2SDC3_9FUNG|nr:hypothetical protein DSO57_1031924 [Entomophthora muscae]
MFQIEAYPLDKQYFIPEVFHTIQIGNFTSSHQLDQLSMPSDPKPSLPELTFTTSPDNSPKLTPKWDVTKGKKPRFGISLLSSGKTVSEPVSTSKDCHISKNIVPAPF